MRIITPDEVKLRLYRSFITPEDRSKYSFISSDHTHIISVSFKYKGDTYAYHPISIPCHYFSNAIFSYQIRIADFINEKLKQNDN